MMRTPWLGLRDRLILATLAPRAFFNQSRYIKLNNLYIRVGWPFFGFGFKITEVADLKMSFYTNRHVTSLNSEHVVTKTLGKWILDAFKRRDGNV